ncbi:MAG: ASCH domain-containing protein [Alphaproteobacteria bacterium]|nr:ASCH domain-containing protein [Alphaproteobacteria bacterium]
MHYMSVKQPYFNLLKTGKKTIELRLFDEKRQKIKMGDYILFSNIDNREENFQGKVINLYWEKNFEALCKKISPNQAGFQTKKELLNALKEFYSEAEQNKFGVIGIEINSKIND